MPVFTIVTTTATRDVETVEVSTLADDFANDSEAIGYSRRMAEEMVGLAAQLSLDFDYSNVSVYEGELLDEDLTPDHPGFQGLWALDDAGPAFVTADELGEEGVEAEG